MMEVTGHYANVRDTQLICPAGISFTNPEECITNEVPLYLWIKEISDGTSVIDLPAPEGWESLSWALAVLGKRQRCVRMHEAGPYQRLK
jgi:hypothetical protein